MAQVLVLGLVSGGIYALFALGVVLVHRGTGVLNFAGGEIGTFAVFLAAYVVTDEQLPWFLGAVVALGFAVAVGLAFEFGVVRRMRGSDPVSVAVATVGLGLLLFGGQVVLFGATPQNLAPPVEGGFELAGVIVTPTQVIGLVLAGLLGFGLQAVLRRTDFGLGILAAAQDPVAVRLVGAPLSRITLTVWALGAALAGLAALLVAPTIGSFAPGSMSELYLLGLAAAVLGGLNNLPGAFLGGIGLGIAESMASRYLDDLGISNLRYVVVLVALLVTLLGRQLLPELQRRLEQSRTREVTA
jgi:branched-chain amino acid transport system permease protein